MLEKIKLGRKRKVRKVKLISQTKFKSCFHTLKTMRLLIPTLNFLLNRSCRRNIDNNDNE